MPPLGLTDALLLLVIGVLTGAVGAVLGTGGGVFLIPILLICFGVPIKYAVGTSILTVVATSTAVAIGNLDRGTANMRLGMTLEIFTSLGALSGGMAAAVLAPPLLEGVFAAVLLPTAFVMWRKKAGDAASRANAPVVQPPSGFVGAATVGNHAASGGLLERLGGEYEDPASHQHVVYRLHRLWAGATISFIAGVMSGLLGIGGGVFKVPALNILCGVPIKAAAATSTFMIGVTAAASAFLYFGRDQVDPSYTTAVVIGVVVGSWIGAYLNRFARGMLIKRVFAALLLGVSVEMFFRAFSGQ
jgi:uncharacterized membrane protein YfcA